MHIFCISTCFSYRLSKPKFIKQKILTEIVPKFPWSNLDFTLHMLRNQGKQFEKQ